MFKVHHDGTIELTRGDTAVLDVGIVNEVTGETYEIQKDDELVLSLKRTISDPEPCMQKRKPGTAQFIIEPEDTNGLRFGRYIYDVQLTTEKGHVYTVIGPAVFEILPEVTC